MKNNKAVLWGGLFVVVIIIGVVWHASLPKMPSMTTTATQATPTDTKTGDIVPTKVTLQNANGTTSTLYPLDGHTFRYASFDNTTIPAGENYLISFSDGVLSGGICANFSGSYVANKGALSTSLISSPKGCTIPADVNAADQIFHTTVGQVSSYTFINNVLTISGNGHTLVFNTFVK